MFLVFVAIIYPVKENRVNKISILAERRQHKILANCTILIAVQVGIIAIGSVIIKYLPSGIVPNPLQDNLPLIPHTLKPAPQIIILPIPFLIGLILLILIFLKGTEHFGSCQTFAFLE